MSRQPEQRRAHLIARPPTGTGEHPSLLDYIESRIASLRELVETHVVYLRRTLEEYKEEMTAKFLTVNEFRGTLEDQQKTFAERTWVEAKIEDLNRQLANHKADADRRFASLAEANQRYAERGYLDAKMESTETRYQDQSKVILERVSRLELGSTLAAQREYVDGQFKSVGQRITEQRDYVDSRTTIAAGLLEARERALGDRVTRLEHALSRAYGIGFAASVALALLALALRFLPI